MRFWDLFGHDLGHECSVKVLESRDVSKRDLRPTGAFLYLRLAFRSGYNQKPSRENPSSRFPAAEMMLEHLCPLAPDSQLTRRELGARSRGKRDAGVRLAAARPAVVAARGSFTPAA